MCWADKCLLIVPLDLGCILIGVSTFISSLTISLISLIILIIEDNNPTEGFYFMKMIFHLDLSPSSIKIILTIIAMAELLLTIFSLMLIIGIKKNKPNFILSYFAYGVFMTILCSLSGLLILISGHWIMAMIKFIGVIIFSHFLVVVHTTYDLMTKGKVFKFVQHDGPDHEILVESSN